MKKAPRRSSGFTLVELIIVTMLSAIVFAGLASLYAEAFKAEVMTVRQTRMQSTATLIEMMLQRDLAEATYIISPAEPGAVATTASWLQGFKNQVCLGNGSVGSTVCTKGWQKVGTRPVTEFFFVYCQVQNTLTYYEVTTTVPVGAPPACPSPGTFMGAQAVYLSEDPPLIFKRIPFALANPVVAPNGPIFTRPPAAQAGATTGGGHHSVRVRFELDYVPLGGVPPVPVIDVDTEMTSNASYIQP
jgi:prepilin-type N-terminal cleavage/methylation domain-containing protein